MRKKKKNFKVFFKTWFPYLLCMWKQCEYSWLTTISDTLLLFDHIECFDFLGGLFDHCWRESFKYNLLFTFEYNFRHDKWYYLFFFLFAFSFFKFQFLVSGMMVRIWVALNAPRPVKFTAFIIRLLQEKYVFFVIIRFSFRCNYHPKFSRKEFPSVSHFCTQKRPKLFIGKFQSIRRKLRFQFYLAWNKTVNKGRSIWGWS